MHNTFFASDHHLGHAGIIEFLNNDGTKLRDFDTIEDMNEHIINQHNSVVRPCDTIWFLGDVVINRRFLALVNRMNGRKRLVMGNHDIFKNADYYKAGFEDLHAFRRFEGFVCTHIPVHPDSLTPRWGVNVHGHTHSNRMNKIVGVYDDGTFIKSREPDPRYISVCMEQLDNYTPISIEELRAKWM